MNLTSRFELRKDTLNKKGEHPVTLILRVSSQRRKLATGVTVVPELWDNHTQRIQLITGKIQKELLKTYPEMELMSNADIKRSNLSLEELNSGIEAIAARFELDGLTYSADMLLDQYKLITSPKTKRTEPNNLVFDFIDKYITVHEPSREKGSMGVYKSLKRHLEAYQKHTRTKVRFSEIDYAFFQSFQNFLIKYRAINNITIAKQLSTLKTFLGYAIKNGITVAEGYKNFKIKRQKLEVIALTNTEFLKIFALDLEKNKRLAQVRDVFCFSCATGFRYSDMVQLQRGHIFPGEIRITVKKTKEPLIVPLNGYSVAILNKYLDKTRPLPIIANNNFNKYIKEIGKLAEINEPTEIIRYKGPEKIANLYPKYELISAHTGRKTFATLSLEKGIPAETVMGITGHTDYKSFQRYIKVTEERKRNEMHKAWGTPDLAAH
jgi:integrase